MRFAGQLWAGVLVPVASSQKYRRVAARTGSPAGRGPKHRAVRAVCGCWKAPQKLAQRGYGQQAAHRLASLADSAQAPQNERADGVRQAGRAGALEALLATARGCAKGPRPTRSPGAHCSSRTWCWRPRGTGPRGPRGRGRLGASLQVFLRTLVHRSGELKGYGRQAAHADRVPRRTRCTAQFSLQVPAVGPKKDLSWYGIATKRWRKPFFGCPHPGQRRSTEAGPANGARSRGLSPKIL